MAKSVRQGRHRSRILAMQAMFQYEARHDEKPNLAELSSFQWIDYAVPEDERVFAGEIIRHTLDHLSEIDELITERLVNWEFSRISPVSRAILRTGVAQLLYMTTDADAAVVIDESILLAKQYDAAETTGFINGLLDDVRSMKNPEAVPVKKVAAGDKIKIRKRVK